MKKVLGICALISILLSSCQKEIPKQIEGYFYTQDKQANEEALKLFFDGKEEGIIPTLDLKINEIRIIDSTFKYKTLHKSFMSGKHLIELRTSSGKILSSGYINFEYYKNKTKTGIGGAQGASGMVMFEGKTDAAIMISSVL